MRVLNYSPGCYNSLASCSVHTVECASIKPMSVNLKTRNLINNVCF